MQAVIVTRTGEHEFRTVAIFDTVAPRLLGFDEPSRFTF
jgi:protein-L-isoaspartate(D-aspartate) O-methyltransferase